MAVNVLTDESLKSEIAMWQKFLRLHDWKIRAEIVDGSYFGDETQLGDCNYWLEERCAIIHLVEPAVGDGIAQTCDHTPYYDMEKTLIHEMLHVFLAPLQVDVESVALEQCICHLTERFASAKWWIISCVKYDETQQLAAEGVIADA